LTFGVKLHRLLEHTKTHREDAGIIGLIWTKQPGVFLANNLLLTSFLGIKMNSVNTNFREHGFVQVKTTPMTSQKLTELTEVSLPDERHWKKLRQSLLVYTQESDENIALQIDIEVRPKFLAQRFHNADVSPSESSFLSQVDCEKLMPIPPTFFQGNSQFLSDALKIELGIVMTNLKHEIEVRHRILDIALSQWIGQFGRIEIVQVQAFLNAFFPLDNHSRMLSMQTNCQFLLGSCTPHSRFFENQVSFVDFIRLFLRYGSSTGFHETFEVITASDSCAGGPCFYDGFCFGWNIATIGSLLRPGDWAIIEGDQLATFSFLTDTILTIVVDPSDDLHHFTFTLANGEQHSAGSWIELLQMIQTHQEHGLHIDVSSSSGSFPRTSSERQRRDTLFDLDDQSPWTNTDDWNLESFG
jgi:hypothetical protein